MHDKQRLVADLLTAISGVLLFLSVSHFLDLNGFSDFSPLLILLGVAMIFWIDEVTLVLRSAKIFSKQIILSLSHVLIFLGLKTYISSFITGYWPIIFAIGIVLLNTNKQISEMLFG